MIDPCPPGFVAVRRPVAYYSENDPYAAAWLRNLVANGLVPAGDVDERDIRDVRPDDLRGYVQCHFFAGIAGWAYAARLAGWPDERPLWTGSCPCQPFSVAGRGRGADDERHLWPDFFRLIRAARPPVVMGEQVAGAAGYGWFDGVRADLASAGYAGRGVDIPACAVDAPHIRSRLYWIAVADSHGERLPSARPGPLAGEAGGDEGSASQRQRLRSDFGPSDDAGGVADAGCFDGRSRPAEQDAWRESANGHGSRRLGDAAGFGWTEGQPGSEIRRHEPQTVAGANARDLGDAHGTRLAFGPIPDERGSPLRQQGATARAADARRDGSAWTDAEGITGHDGKVRRSAPGVPLLAHGVPDRVALWRGFGNAIVAPLAAEVIAAFMEVAP